MLFLLQSVSSFILNSFEELIEKRLAITLFPTMLLGTGGDAGSQSSAIRGLATVKYNIGAHSALLHSRVIFTVHSSKDALKVSVALFVVWAVAARAQVPLLLEYCGADPAQCASPVLATATDIVGVFVI
ncbi:magnesium transporter, MgtE family isoform 1 [Galdieria sulphuraria]|uniref:Magnesium transporter, MgtE family isoform 1 n=1 Tax=Galdieria sulphuraria TaxID=130081 RepID=M2XGX3_GALSU|nr:magnesium transporter, MgtE family isoform 1 [Galdieria sulphuraria]EME29317.1 magnesium transporter, MgtE family isoform 1 [Galdieria sulphuraria]|eukprot:XP_005705837.1 magnesium transporter, MgtE family isoform 1 [Galdieria sulphuraria]